MQIPLMQGDKAGGVNPVRYTNERRLPWSVQNFRVLGREPWEESGLAHGDGEDLFHVRPAFSETPLHSDTTCR